MILLFLPQSSWLQYDLVSNLGSWFKEWRESPFIHPSIPALSSSGSQGARANPSCNDRWSIPWKGCWSITGSQGDSWDNYAQSPWLQSYSSSKGDFTLELFRSAQRNCVARVQFSWVNVNTASALDHAPKTAVLRPLWRGDRGTASCELWCRLVCGLKAPQPQFNPTMVWTQHVWAKKKKKRLQ